MKSTNYLIEANRITNAVEHLLYVTYPIFKNKKVLIKSLVEIKKSLAYTISAALQYEYLLKNINLSKDPKLNLNTFICKCSKKYKLSKEEIQEIENLFELIQKHKQSSMEFLRNENLVIITDKETNTLKIEKIKEFLKLSKKLIENTQTNILEKYKKT